MIFSPEPEYNNMKRHLILGMTGASGVYASKLFIKKSPWPIDLIASNWAKVIYNRESGPFEELAVKAASIYDNKDLKSPLSSGSVPTAGMVILPCSSNTMGQVASGLCDSLISRAAHCHLKERRPLVMCLRETPLTAIDLENASRITLAGGIIMPLSPPFYMFDGKDPDKVTMVDLLTSFVDRVLSVLGHPADKNWEDVK